MGIICLQCGDKGFTNAYVYCVKCLKLAVHRYCLDVIPETFDEIVHWVCDDCEAESQNQSAIPNHDAKDVKRFSIIETNKNILSRVQTEEHVCKDVPDQLYDACTKLDLIECHESAGEHDSLPVEGKNDDRAIVSLEDKGKIRQHEKKEKRKLMRQTRSLKCTVKKNKKKKRKSVIKSTLEKDVHELGHKSFKKDHEERVDLQLVLACEVKDGNGSEPRDKKCVSYECSKKKKKTISTPEAILQGQIKDVKIRELEGREDNRFAACNDDILCGDIPKDLAGDNILCGDTPKDLVDNILCGDIPKDLHISSAQPVARPIWSGSFNIWNTKRDTLDGLMAHMSVQACQKVYEEARLFKPVLHLEMLPKSDVWPKSFDISEPRGENIALYFFPSLISECDFDILVDKMMSKELALKAFVQNAELLIFTSTELPLLYWRFQGKNYLWGVFRAKQSSPSNSHPCRKELKDKSATKHTDKTSEPTKRSNARSPCSPLSSSASYGSCTPSMLE